MPPCRWQLFHPVGDDHTTADIYNGKTLQAVAPLVKRRKHSRSLDPGLSGDDELCGWQDGWEQSE
jgi:hypothetical protein